MNMLSKNPNRNFIFFLIIMMITIIFSAYKPHHQILWFAHSISVLIGLALLIATHKKFPFTSLTYILMWLYGTVMLIGAHYTYEHEPFFYFIQDSFDLSRNYYDRFGHFFQGFTPAIIIREILIRNKVLKKKRWLFFITVSVCLAMSAFYELGEWWFALLSGEKAEISLGMQGDFWDTQWDLLMTVIGAFTSILLLAKMHDKQIDRLKITQDVHQVKP